MPSPQLLAIGAGALATLACLPAGLRDARRRAISLSPLEAELRKRRLGALAALAAGTAVAAGVHASGWPPVLAEYGLAGAGAGLAAVLVLTVLLRIARRRLLDDVGDALRELDARDPGRRDGVA